MLQQIASTLLDNMLAQAPGTKEFLRSRLSLLSAVIQWVISQCTCCCNFTTNLITAHEIK